MQEEDAFDLQRFVLAQGTVYRTVLAELSNCRKVTHWIWFIFPQFAGLGHSATSKKFAIRSLDEGRAYLAHETLGPRLIECTTLVCRCPGRSIGDIFYAPDDRKFHSSMTLFKAASERPEFFEALKIFFAGKEDAATLELVART